MKPAASVVSSQAVPQPLVVVSVAPSEVVGVPVVVVVSSLPVELWPWVALVLELELLLSPVILSSPQAVSITRPSAQATGAWGAWVSSRAASQKGHTAAARRTCGW